jgi:hypothetical protein
MGIYTTNLYPPVNAVDIAAWPNSVGGRIMAAVPGNTATTVAEMTALVNAFQGLGWTWNPNIGGRGRGKGRELLDRHIANIGSGECGYLAHALNELLAAPAPYGFGIVGSVTATYDGAANAHGFLSVHNGNVHNLPPNTSLPNGVALQNVRRWGDHVVVSYLGRYWDPSYDTHYPNLHSMATHNFTIHSALIQRTFDVHFECTPIGGGNNVWYRVKQQWETTLPHLPVGGLIGPFIVRQVTPPRPAQVNSCAIL